MKMRHLLVISRQSGMLVWGGPKIVCIIFMLLSFLKDIRLHLTKDANEISSVTKAPQLTGLARAAALPTNQ